MGNETILMPQFERLQNIHQKIAEKFFPSTKQLAIWNEVSEATISRDIELLKVKYNAPIEYSALERGYYYSADFELPIPPTLNADDIHVLSLIKTLLAYFKKTPTYEKIEKLLNSITKLSYKKNNQFINRIAIAPTPEISINANIWNKIVYALENNFIVKFDYKGSWNKSDSYNVVHPYQLLIDNGCVFLWGFSEEKQECRLFNLTKISCLLVTQKHFILKENFEFEKYSGGGKFGSYVTKNLKDYEIKFYEDSRDFVRSCKWADDQEIIENEEDESTTIKFSSNQDSKIMEWVLSQSPNAQPIAPQEFVNWWKIIIKTLNVYLE